MAATFTVERGEFVSATDATAYEIVAAGLGTFTPNANSTLVAIIVGAETTDATYDLSSFASTGMSLTWTQWGTGRAWTNTQFYRLHIFTAPVGASPSTVSTATATWSEGILSCDAWIGEWAGAPVVNPIAQENTATNASGVDPSASLSVAPRVDSSVLFTAMTRRNPPGWTPEAGWTEDMDNGVSTPVTGLYVAHVTSGSDQTFTSTGTDAANFSVILEIAAAVTASAANGKARTRATAAAPTIIAPAAAANGRARTRATGVGTVSGGVVTVDGTGADRARARSTAAAPTIIATAAAGAGRARTRALGVGTPITGATGAARSRARASGAATPLANGTGANRARTRSSAAGANLAIGVGAGRARTRATAVGVSFVTAAAGADRARVRSGTATVTTVTAFAGADRARARATGAALNLAAGVGASRSRSRSVATGTVLAVAAGASRSRARSSAAATVLVTAAAAAGRARLRALGIGTVLVAGTVQGTGKGWARTRATGSASVISFGPLILGHRGLTAGAAPSGSLTILGTEGLTVGAVASGLETVLGTTGLTAGAAPSGDETIQGHEGLTAGSPPSGDVLVLGHRGT